MTHDEVKAVLAEGRKNVAKENDKELASLKERIGENFHSDMYGIDYETEYRKMLNSGMSVSEFQNMVGGSDFFSMQIGNRALACLNTGKVSMDEVRACFNDGFTFDQKWSALYLLEAQAQSEHPYHGSLTELLKPEYTDSELSRFANAIRYKNDNHVNVINGIKAETEIKASSVYSKEQRSALTERNELANAVIGDERKILIVADPDRSSSWMNNMIMYFTLGLTVEQAEKYTGPEFADKQSDMLCFVVSGKYPMPDDMVDTMAGLDLSADQISAVWDAYDKYNGSQKEFIGHTRLVKDDIDMLIDRNLSPKQIKRLTGLLSNVTDNADRQVIYELAASGLPDREWSDTAEKIEVSEDYKETMKMMNRDEDRLEKLKEKYKDVPKRDLTDNQRFNMKNLQKSIDHKEWEIRMLEENYPDIDKPVTVPSAEKFADKEPERVPLRKHFEELQASTRHDSVKSAGKADRTQDVLS